MAQNVAVKRSSLLTASPGRIPVPPLLLEFADWLANVPHGGLGYFDALAGESLDNAFSDDRITDEMRQQIAIFLFLPDGSRLALWQPGSGDPAVVLLGSEGELENIAPSLLVFLVALSEGKTGVDDLDDEEAGSHRAALATWLAGRDPGNPSRVPCFADWYEAKLEGREPPATASVVTAPSSEPMPMFTATMMSLMGRSCRDGGLQGFLTALGHWPLPPLKPAEDLYVEDKPRGYCLIFGESKNPEDRKAKLPVLTGGYLYSEGEEDYRAFAQAMPKGIGWGDSAVSLAAPTSEIKSKKTGALTSQRWLESDRTQPYVTVGYSQNGEVIKTVYVGILSTVS